MLKNYLTYPCKVMRITQNYLGKTSHYPHTAGYPKDYPIDEGGKDTGKDPLYCPCDEMIVRRIFGVGSGGTNTIWLESTDRVFFADGTTDFFTMLVTHPDDADLKYIKVGDTFKRGQAITKEGKDGATANHLHISGGKGKYRGSGWEKNSKGKWVLTTMCGTFKPEELFYIDPDFTKVLSKGSLNFKTLPEEKEYKPGKYKVTGTNVLRIRPTPGTDKPYKKFSELSASAQKKIKALNGGKPADGYVRGLEFTVTKVKDNWGYNNSGYMCLDYCEKVEV